MSRHCIVFAACLFAQAAWAQRPGFPYPPQMEGAQVEVYKTAGNARLSIYIFNPPGHQTGARRPAIVFFFGGGWRSGSPKQFEQQCRYLSSRGTVAMAADYRVASRHGVKAIDCVRDAKSAIRWVRRNASRLGIHPGRIAAGGGSAGGHLAAAAGVITGLDEPGEDLQVSSRPDALVLFNPALVLAPVASLARPVVPAKARERFGADPEALSPYHHLTKGAPPTIIFHGKADTTVPYATVELFARKSAALGNRCELVGFEGEQHGFFNYGRGGGQRYRETLARTDEFLASLGYLDGKPRVLLIGDSISIGYTAPVRTLLHGKASVHRIPENGGPTTNGLAKLAGWLGDGRWDVLHFNWGLHDLRLMEDGKHQVPLEAYEKNLRELVKRLKATGARLIWACTTPVPPEKQSPPRRTEDVPLYNAAAKKVMDENQIPVNDLYSFALPRLSEIQRPANVHFTEEGSAALASRVAASIERALGR